MKWYFNTWSDMILINNLVTGTFLFISFVAGQQHKGDVCKLKDGSNGICKLIEECPKVRADLQNGVFPQTCGYEHVQPVVCCLLLETVEKPKSVTTSKRTELPTATKSTLASDSKLRLPGVISNQKCQNYSEYVWNIEKNPTLLVGGTDVRMHECPYLKKGVVDSRNLASRREFPHMVQFGYDASDGLKWTCGGSLISDQFVLTAAHCLSDRSLGNAKYARMGLIDLEDDEHMQQIDIAQIIPHPEYNAPSYYHDVGLVKLSKRVILNSFVRPACIYTNRSISESKAIATGWGKIGFAGPESNILLMVTLELYGQPECNKTYKQQYGSNKLQKGIIDETMICAGHSKDLKDTCQGDSGSPLQVYRKGDEQLSCMYDVIGITSFGKACGLAVNIPAVYTRVSHYTKWIEDTVWPPTL